MWMREDIHKMKISVDQHIAVTIMKQKQKVELVWMSGVTR